jgi:hypothetical protein
MSENCGRVWKNAEFVSLEFCFVASQSLEGRRRGFIYHDKWSRELGVPSNAYKGSQLGIILGT